MLTIKRPDGREPTVNDILKDDLSSLPIAAQLGID